MWIFNHRTPFYATEIAKSAAHTLSPQPADTPVLLPKTNSHLHFIFLS
ncbi:hypothetical protein FM102_05910 [Corynebacterium glutamicum]|nr:hypothetical protein FM102_05910 [Corynebacterium glutamicum]